uniref:I/LWEQ domain-containing protein n=1 Tax=Ditylenchus dipsaci TaxID=166011 RepID=A0A915D6V7_9BILA
MFYAVKDSGGNPKAVELHTIVEDQLNSWLLPSMKCNTMSISWTLRLELCMDYQTNTCWRFLCRCSDQNLGCPAGNQSNSNGYALSDPQVLGQLSLKLAERYKELTGDARIAGNLLTSPNLAQRLKVAVQNLVRFFRSVCIDIVKIAGQRRAHPNDERIYQTLSATSSIVAERVREVLAVLNEGSRGTQACINAAQTCSLNPPSVPGKTLEFGDHREIIIRTAKALVEDTKALVSGAASNQEQLAVAAQNAVRTILNLTEAVKEALLPCPLTATKHASGRTPNDPAIGNLKEAAKIMVTNLFGNTTTTKHRRHAATAEEVIRAAGKVTEATARATGAASNLQQEHVIAAANLARQAVGELLATTRAAALNTDHRDAELKYKTLNAGRDVALQVKQLLATLHGLLSRPDDRQVKNAILVASREVAKAVGDLAQCGEQLRADSNWPENSEPTVIAENELMGAANSIEEAAVKLAKLRPRQVHKPDENLTFDEQILSAAKSIATAVQTLVKAASSANENWWLRWSEGLISAARLVAAAVHQLCEAANGLVQGHATEEKLISAAKQVASSTAHLLVACKVKSDIDSRAMQRLQTAGHAVKTATEHLVAAARQAITEDERTLIISDRMVTGIAQVMDAQEAVLRKERELVEARKQLAQSTRADMKNRQTQQSPSHSSLLRSCQIKHPLC